MIIPKLTLTEPAFPNLLFGNKWHWEWFEATVTFEYSGITYLMFFNDKYSQRRLYYLSVVHCHNHCPLLYSQLFSQLHKLLLYFHPPEVLMLSFLKPCLKTGSRWIYRTVKMEISGILVPSHPRNRALSLIF